MSPIVQPCRSGSGLLSLVLVCATAGCVTERHVRVRDPAEVSLRAERADRSVELLAPGAAPRAAVVAEGDYYWGFLNKARYRIVATREPTGTTLLRCTGCDTEDWRYHGGRRVIALVSADGQVLPSLWSPDVTRENLVVRHNLCWLHHRRHCEASTYTEVAIPWTNVTDARSRTEPLRLAGPFLIVLGVGFLAAGTLAVSPVFDDVSTKWRVAIAAPSFTLGAAFTGAGIWTLTAPEHVEALQPPRQENTVPTAPMRRPR